MATTLKPGPRRWSLVRDSEGHRTYRVTQLVRGEEGDGPNTVLNTPGLPLPGSVWEFENDLDIWAFCLPDLTINPHQEKEGDKTKWWTVDQTYSTRIPNKLQRCQDQQIEDPLMEPPRLSGSFLKFREEASYDRYGSPVVTSSWEQIRGAQVEFDASRMQIRITQNVLLLNLSILALMIDTLNAFPLWGMPPRTIKLSNVSWERKLYGLCTFYYTRTLEFDIDGRGFDKDILDEGTKALSGRWNPDSGEWDLVPIAGEDPDPFNPLHFIRYQDPNGNLTKVILNGAGLPYNPTPFTRLDEPYCNQCLDDAPLQWTAKGFDYLYPNDTVTLTHTSDCTWANGTTSLSYDSFTDTWRFIWGGDNPAIWIKESADWRCLGSNTLLFSLGPSSTPPRVTVTPGQTISDNVPGTIRIEKYPESDFLLLGIPVLW